MQFDVNLIVVEVVVIWMVSFELTWGEVFILKIVVDQGRVFVLFSLV